MTYSQHYNTPGMTALEFQDCYGHDEVRDHDTFRHGPRSLEERPEGVWMYRISNRTSGTIYGVFEGTSKDDALDTLARAAGYADYHDYREACGDELFAAEIESD